MGEGIIFLGIVVIFIAIGIGGRLIAGMLNHDRIRIYIKNKGGKVTKIIWTPFGPGWFGEKNAAIYEVDYYDRDGNYCRAHCKTSMFSGVYLHNDRLVSAVKPQQMMNNYENQTKTRQVPMSLEEENQKLKEENELLRYEIETLKRNRF